MSSYILNNSNIDVASAAVTGFLSKQGVSSKEVQRIRLSVEEVLLKYLDNFRENKKQFQVIASKRFKTLRIELVIAGESIDPFEDESEDSAVLNRLLANIGLAPVWRYKNGKNIITFTAKKKKMSQILQLGVAILAAAALGGLCYLLPQGVSEFITVSVITPVFNTFMGLLSAISGPIVFLSVVWGILGIGDIATFGKIGKRMIGRFLIISVLVGIAGTAGCALFFKLSVSGETAFAFSELYEMILDIIPANLLTPFVEGNSLQIIFIAFIVGFAMLMLGGRVSAVTSFIEQANSVMHSIMSAVSSFIPFFVFGSVLNMIVGNNFSAVAKSYKLILIMLLADIILMAFYLFTVSGSLKVSPMVLLKKTMPTFVIALTTASSTAAYQTNITDCLSKKVRVNNGERPKYYVENSHPAIIDSGTFGRVQEELARRAGKSKVKNKGTKTQQGRYSSKYALTELLVCGECKTPYRRCTWKIGGKKKIVWRCINRLDYGKKYCRNSPSVEESALHKAIMSAIMSTALQNEDVIKILKLHIGMGLNNESAVDNSLEIQIRIAEIDAEFTAMLKSVSAETEETFDEGRAKELMDEKARLQQQLLVIASEKQKQKAAQSRLEDIYTILDGLKNHPMVYDDEIVRQLLECVVVESKSKIKVVFKGGYEIEREM